MQRSQSIPSPYNSVPPKLNLENYAALSSRSSSAASLPRPHTITFPPEVKNTMSSFIGGMPTTTLDRHRQMHLRSRSPTQRPRLHTLRSRKPPKQRSSARRRPYRTLTFTLCLICGTAKTVVFCSVAHAFSICAGHSRSDVQLGAQFTYLAWNKFGSGRFQRPIPPPHIHRALSPIGPITHYLSCLSSFSSQPSPFPLPFHYHWLSFNAESERLL